MHYFVLDQKYQLDHAAYFGHELFLEMMYFVCTSLVMLHHMAVELVQRPGAELVDVAVGAAVDVGVDVAAAVVETVHMTKILLLVD